jgi:hypothetical protein
LKYHGYKSNYGLKFRPFAFLVVSLNPEGIQWYLSKVLWFY